jgi:hypothetical protein
MTNTTTTFRKPNVDTEALFVGRGQMVELYLDDRWVVGRVNSTPRHHEGKVGFSVWTDRHEGVWCLMPQDHPVVLLG